MAEPVATTPAPLATYQPPAGYVLVPTPAPAPAPTPRVPSPNTPWYVLVFVLVLIIGWDRYREWHTLHYPGPGPAPIPAPPNPGPGPTPGPMPTPVKLRVLFLYDSANPGSRDATGVLYSMAIRTYLADHTIMDRNVRGYRFWDQGVDATRESPGWQEALAKAKADPTPTPKLAIFDPADALLKVAPLTNETDALATLQAIGGP